MSVSIAPSCVLGPLPLRRGPRPARASPHSGRQESERGATPLVDALLHAAGDGTVPFHVPGHAVRSLRSQ